jgi:glyoxylase-like metal-dependent hydrolase (beta-lactamase superfamily II)
MFDCGMHEPGSLAHLERALAQVNLRLENVNLLAITHAHSDHVGQADTVIERAGCEMWMHPNDGHMRLSATDPEQALARRVEVARQSGVPEAPLEDYAERRRGQNVGIARFVEPDEHLVEGSKIDTDLGAWDVYETPGHAPSHVVFFQPERRMLISGDHLLGRISLYYDYGWTPDPVGEFLASLDKVEQLGARLVLSGHGRTFTDVRGHIDGNRALVQERLDAARDALNDGPRTGFDVVPAVFGEQISAATASWWLPEVLCYLTHLEATGVVEKLEDGEHERWALAT